MHGSELIFLCHDWCVSCPKPIITHMCESLPPNVVTPLEGLFGATDCGVWAAAKLGPSIVKNSAQKEVAVSHQGSLLAYLLACLFVCFLLAGRQARWLESMIGKNWHFVTNGPAEFEN